MKQTLDKSHVGQASDKAASVRDLHRTSGPIPNQFNLEARKDLAAFSAIAGILCERSDWSTPLGDAFDACIADNKGPRGIDLGCALSDGSFEFDWRGGEFTIDKSQTANALIYFAMRLLRRWQAMATVPAIDYAAYEVPCSTNPGRFRPGEVSPSGFGVSRPDMAAQRHEQRFESARRTARHTAAYRPPWDRHHSAQIDVSKRSRALDISMTRLGDSGRSAAGQSRPLSLRSPNRS